MRTYVPATPAHIHPVGARVMHAGMTGRHAIVGTVRSVSVSPFAVDASDQYVAVDWPNGEYGHMFADQLTPAV